jgi:hypothetical protein
MEDLSMQPPRTILLLTSLGLLTLLAVLGCAASSPYQEPKLFHQFEMGQPLDNNKTSQIIEGKTTEQEAIILLGRPQTVQQRPDGSRILIYSHHINQMSGPSASNLQGGISHEMVFLGVRDGIVKKKWQNSTYQPASSFTGVTK